MVYEDGAIREATVEEAKKILPKKTDPKNQNLAADWNFNCLKAETQHSGEIFPWNRLVWRRGILNTRIYVQSQKQSYGAG